MAYYSTALTRELQLSRRLALQRQLEYSEALEKQKLAQAQELQFREIKEIQRFREEEEFRNYQLIKKAELAHAEETIIKDRLYREERDRQHQSFLEADRRSRLLREEELDAQIRLAQEDQRRKKEVLAASRRVELQHQIRVNQQIQRENSYLLQEQATQQKLQKQLREIDLQIGSIHDTREQRKRLQLQQLQKLDEQLFKLRQKLRESKVNEIALEEQLVNLSKLIVA